MNTRLICKCRCDYRLKTKDEGSTRLLYTGFHGGLEHLKVETRLIDERCRGTGTPKDKDEVKRREVCECEG